MLKYIGILFALLLRLCEAQQQDLNKTKVELKELNTKLMDAFRATSVNAARRVGDIVQQIKNKCSNDVYESAKELREKFFRYLQQLNEEIIDEIALVEDVSKRLNGSIDQEDAAEIVKDFPKYKKSIVDGLTKNKKFIDLQYEELNRMLKTCSASRPADEIVPQTGSTTNIPLASATLTTAAAFIAIKLAFH